MYPSTILALLSVLFLSVPVTPMPVNDAPLEKRTTYAGEGTYFAVGLGACGHNNVDSDFIVALPTSQYAAGTHCDQYVFVKNTQTGKTAYAQVRDECPGCGWGHLDMSPGLFQKGLGAQESEGVIPITWNFMAKGWHP